MNTIKAALKHHAQTFARAVQAELGDNAGLVIMIADDRGRTFVLSNLKSDSGMLVEWLNNEAKSPTTATVPLR